LVWKAQQDFLKLDLPDNHFDCVFANAAAHLFLLALPNQNAGHSAPERIRISFSAPTRKGGIKIASTRTE
jgi:hypothetical protein